MLSLEDFKEAISFIKDHETLQNRFCDVLEELAPGNYCDCYLFADYETIFLKMLTIALNINNDESKKDILTWWLYDCDFGKHVTEFIEDGKSILLTTIDDLYNYLSANHSVNMDKEDCEYKGD